MDTRVIADFFVSKVGNDIAGLIYEFAEDPVYDEFCANLYKLTRRHKKVKFNRYCKNLRYDAFNIYSYDTAVAKVDLDSRTIQRLGYWSITTTKHINYAIHNFCMCYNFTEKARETKAQR